MSPRSTIERELKLGVWDGFVLPMLELAAGPPSERRLEAVYYDTSDLRLLRRGVTARFRRGEGWTAKLPGEAAALGLTRREVSVSGGEGALPEELADLLRGWALGAALAPVARLDTLRRTVELRDAGGRLVAVIDDDDVSVLKGALVAARFRELEVELAPDAPASVLEDIARRLSAGGAQPVDQVPKLVRALGAAAVEPWPLAPDAPAADASAADVIRYRLTRAAAALADLHAPVVLDGAGVRGARAAVRSLRRDVRLFRPLLEGSAPELNWVSDAFGRVRRLDVLLDRVVADASIAPRGAGDAVAAVLARLREARADAYERLLAGLREERYDLLLAQLAAVVRAPPLVKAARRPAADVLPRLVRRPLGRLREAEGREAEALRTPATRLAHAVAVAAPYAGRDARRAADALAELTDVLSEHHRATVAIRALHRLAISAPAETAWGAGLLAGLEATRAAESRARLGAVWTQALRRKHWAWVP